MTKEAEYQMKALRAIVVLVAMLIFLTTPMSAKTVLQVMDWKTGETNTQWLNWAKVEFERRHPDVTVEYLIVPFGEYVDQLVINIASGISPDVANMSVIWGRDLYDQGVLLNLTQRLERDADEIRISDYVPVALPNVSRDADIFGVPDDLGVGPLFFNIDHFEEAGLDPSGAGIHDWDSFVQAMHQLVRSDSSGNVTRHGYASGVGIQQFTSWLDANGGGFYNEAMTQSNLDNPNAQQVVDFYSDLFTREFLTGTFTDFTNGNASVGHGGTYSPGNIRLQNPSLNYGIMPYPQGPLGTHEGAIVWSNMITIPQASDKIELAWEWVKFYTSLPSARERFKIIDSPNSSRLDFFSTPEWQDVEMSTDWGSGFVNALLTGTGVFPFYKYSEIIEHVWQPILDKAIRGEVASRSSITEAHRILNGLLADASR